MTPIATTGLHPNLTAFLMLITKTEGTDRDGKPYNVNYGYSYFTDFSKHPQKRVTFYNPKTKKNDYSTAAGRYQINYPTFKELGIKDFTPKSQDAAAIALIKKSGALNDVIAGKFTEALKKTSGRWASLPYSDSNQPKVTLATALKFLKDNGGSIAAVSIAGLAFAAVLIILSTFK